MTTYLIQRFINMGLVIIGVVSIVFLLGHLIPGDPVEVLLGETASATDREALRTQLGLNQPLYQQWWQYIGDLCRFELGHSLYSGQPVREILLARLPTTGYLAVSSLIVAILIAFPLGIIAAIYQGSVWDRLAMGCSIIGISIPNFWMGPLLILVFSLWLGWFPSSGQQGFSSVILPALTLGSALAAILSRMIRASMLEVLQEEYIRAALARGLRYTYVVIQHALRNAALPVITVLGMQLGSLLTGTVITETIFAWPGLGQLTIEAIQRRDYPVLQACVLLVSLIYTVVNLITDLLYVLLDPRIRLQS